MTTTGAKSAKYVWLLMAACLFAGYNLALAQGVWLWIVDGCVFVTGAMAPSLWRRER